MAQDYSSSPMKETATIDKTVDEFKMTDIYSLDENILTEDFLIEPQYQNNLMEVEEIDDFDRFHPNMHVNDVFQEVVHLGGNEPQAQESTAGVEDIIEKSSEKLRVIHNHQNLVVLTVRYHTSSSKETAAQLSVTLASGIIPLPKRKRIRRLRIGQE